MSGTKWTDETAYKFATLSLVGKSMPIVLAVEPVIESSEWDDNPPHRTIEQCDDLLDERRSL